MKSVSAVRHLRKSVFAGLAFAGIIFATNAFPGAAEIPKKNLLSFFEEHLKTARRCVGFLKADAAHKDAEEYYLPNRSLKQRVASFEKLKPYSQVYVVTRLSLWLDFIRKLHCDSGCDELYNLAVTQFPAFRDFSDFRPSIPERHLFVIQLLGALGSSGKIPEPLRIQIVEALMGLVDLDVSPEEQKLIRLGNSQLRIEALKSLQQILRAAPNVVDPRTKRPFYFSYTMEFDQILNGHNLEVKGRTFTIGPDADEVQASVIKIADTMLREKSELADDFILEALERFSVNPTATAALRNEAKSILSRPEFTEEGRLKRFEEILDSIEPEPISEERIQELLRLTEKKLRESENSKNRKSPD